MLLRLLSIGLLLVGLTSAACTASYPTEPTKAAPVGLSIQYAIPKGRIGTAANGANRYSFSAITVDGDGAFEVVTSRASWLSSDDNVARPDAAGVFVPVGPGRADAIVRFAGMEATAPMVVVESALLDSYPRLNVVSPGTSPRAWLREGPFTSQSRNVTSSASWTSSDPRVATISAAGAVTAGSGIGTTLITATFNGLTDWYWLSIGPRQQ